MLRDIAWVTCVRGNDWCAQVGERGSTQYVVTGTQGIGRGGIRNVPRVIGEVLRGEGMGYADEGGPRAGALPWMGDDREGEGAGLARTLPNLGILGQ